MGAWKIGFGKSIVTPPLGVPLSGYGLKPERTAGAVMDDLFARAIVFEDGRKKAALVSIDIISVHAPLANAWRGAVEKSAGIPREAVMLACTHTHSGPAGAFSRHWGAMDASYLRTLEKKITDAVSEAAGKLAPAALGLGQAEAPGVALNRVRKDGPVDHTLRVLGFAEPSTQKVLGAAANFSCHPVTMHSSDRCVTADFPGRMVRDIEREHPGAFGVFVQGALGDINPAGTHKGPDAAQDHGRVLSAAARQTLEGMSFQPEGELAWSRVDCDLPLDHEDARREALEFLVEGKVRKNHAGLCLNPLLREWAHETLGLLAANPPARLRCEVQALRIGELAIVGLPGEIYTLIAQAIREASPYKHTWIAGFANGVVGYVTDPRDYAEETYAAALAPKIYGYPPFKPEAWRVLADAGIRALQGLRNA